MRRNEKGADSDEPAPLIGYASATGGNMQTAPYQFAETSVTAPSAVNLNTFMSLSGQTSETCGLFRVSALFFYL